MFWDKDDWDESYDELVYGKEEDEEEENDVSAQYFDVPAPYRSPQTKLRRNI